MIFYIYILKSKSANKYYTGLTNGISRRLKQHNQNNSSTRTTKALTDYELVFCQITNNLEDARKLEIYLKSGSGREIRKEIVK